MFIKKIFFSFLLSFGILFSLNGVFAEGAVTSNGSIFLETLPGLDVSKEIKANFEENSGKALKHYVD